VLLLPVDVSLPSGSMKALQNVKNSSLSMYAGPTNVAIFYFVFCVLLFFGILGFEFFGKVRPPHTQTLVGHTHILHSVKSIVQHSGIDHVMVAIFNKMRALAKSRLIQIDSN